MTDSLVRLENDLAKLCPALLSPAVAERIANDLERAPMSLADRSLLTVAGAGALAACLIVGLLGWQLTGGSMQQQSSSASPALAIQNEPATLGQYQQTFARSENVNFANNN